MKKIIAPVLAAVLCLSPASAMASGRTQAISEAARDNSEIHILYNDTIVNYEDVTPLNNDGRVMIPFRAALENMGASIDYDVESRLVTAKKGDTVIRFTLMDDTIYVNNSGEESQIKMDVPMMIKDDRTLVPIRFMSEAFGMQVGWDGDTETVVIMDYDSFFDEFRTAAPNIAAAADLGKKSKSRSRSVFDFSYEKNPFKPITASGSAERVSDGDAAELVMQISAGNDKFSVENATAHVIVKDMKLYMQTDAVSTIAQSSGNVLLQAAALIAGKDAWYSVDLAKLFEAAGYDSLAAEIFETVLSMKDFDAKTMFMNGITTDGDAVYNEAVSLAMQMDLFEALDNYVKVSMKDNGGYTVTVNIKPEDFAQAVSALGGAVNGSLMSVNVGASVDNNVTGQTSSGEIDIKTADRAIRLSLTDEEAADEDAAVTAAPQDSIDITDAARALLLN